MSKGYFHRLNDLTATRGWINNPTREESWLALDAGIVNCTTNPTFTMKQIQREPKLMNPIIDEICSRERDDHRAAALVQRASVGHIMEEFSGVFDPETRTSGLVSLQGDPILENEPQIIIDEALEARALGPNYLAKIPVTDAGLKAIDALVREDLPIIATEIMSLSQAEAACEVYLTASAESGKTPPYFVTHITGIFDDHIQNVIREGNIDISPDIAFQAGTAVARKQYRLFMDRRYPGIMLGGGARGLHHFTEFVGGAMCVTINWKNSAETLVAENPPIVERIDTPVPDYVVEELLAKVPDFRLAWEEDGLSPEEYETYGPVILFRDAFVAGWQYLLDEIRKRR